MLNNHISVTDTNIGIYGTPMPMCIRWVSLCLVHIENYSGDLNQRGESDILRGKEEILNEFQQLTKMHYQNY